MASYWPTPYATDVFYSRTHDHTSRLLHLALSGLLISMCPQPKSGPHETR